MNYRFRWARPNGATTGKLRRDSIPSRFRWACPNGATTGKLHMLWDPEVESPATIAVIGAGPVGIEAALYARFLGYDVELFDSGRPARNATRWHQRSIETPVRDCTTPLGHAALKSQDAAYQPPESNRVFAGKEFADEYLIPLAKTDLLIDSVHINSRVIEVSRLRTSLEDQNDLQERCNDEFRLLIHSRDRGFYTRRADIVLDCRGSMSGACGWGPAGSQSIGAADVLEHVHPWLPGDPRFELRSVHGKQTILFGQSELAIVFAREWSSLIKDTELAPDLKLLWLIPTVSASSDANAACIAAELSAKHSDPKRFSTLTIRGIERVVRDESGRWTLELLHADDSTVELSGDVFAPFSNARPTPSIGQELRSHEFAFCEPTEDTIAAAQPTFYADWPGWQVATYEPHYYRLGSNDRPKDPSGLDDVYHQIRDLFALIGARENLNLYDIVQE